MGLGSVNVPGASKQEMREVRNIAQSAKNDAVVAHGAALDAERAANVASQNAVIATNTANAAKEDSETAIRKTEILDGKVTEAEETVKTADSKGATALQMANSAISAANEAKATADSVMEVLRGLIDTVIVPFQKDTLFYTGEELAPAWSCYDPDKMTVSGQTTATDAGTYTVTFTLKQLCEWTDGTTDPKDVTWTIGKATVGLPAPNKSLVYTGAEQTQTWSNYNGSKLTIGGQTAGTNAGTYTATFTPTGNFQWENGTTVAKEVTWSIGKAAGKVTLDKQKVTLDAKKTSDTVKVTRSGNGEITAVSSNKNVATVSVSGTTITVTEKGEGTATVTINVSADSNHNAPVAVTFSVAVTLVKIYGVEWDGTSTTKWTRTDDAALFTDPVPYMAGISNYGSPFDNLYPWNGMAKVERTGGTEVAIPKFWYKLERKGAKGLKIQIADNAVDGFHVSPAHMDRGDGNGERDIVYIGRYHCASDYKSKTGVKPKASISRSAARNSIHNLGGAFWQADFAVRFTLWLLYMVEYADWNTQAKIGYGCGNDSAPESMGYTDNMPYHTGTTKSSRTTYGVGTQYRNIEGLWDNVYDWMDGCYYNSNGLNIILNPEKYNESANGTLVGKPSSGYPSAFGISEAAGFPMFYPTEANGSDSTYSCDNWHFYASNPCLYVGGSYYQSQSRGLFCVGYYSASGAGPYFGCRLLELP